MQSLIFDSVILVTLVAGIPMIGIAFTSGVVALLQAVTQIQEQSVSHLVKFLTLLTLVFVGGDWVGNEVAALFERSLRAIEMIGRRGR
jgi:type III secretory pathway component EscS